MSNRLYARILLKHSLIVRMGPPLLTLVIEILSFFIGNKGRDLVLSHNELQRETFGSMPSNVTMHKPNTGVIAIECDD